MEFHLGKSSFGWKFHFQYNGGKYYKNIKEFKNWLKDKIIYDEYDRQVSKKDFWDLVNSKQNVEQPCLSEKDEESLGKKIIEGFIFYDCKFS